MDFQASPSSIQDTIERARGYLASGQLEEVEQIIETCASTHPQHPEVLILQDAIAGVRLLQEQERGESRKVILRLERELRFAMALMTLLFCTGIWGFWKGAVTESSEPKTTLSGSVHSHTQGGHRHSASTLHSSSKNSSLKAPTPKKRMPRVQPVSLRPKPVVRTPKHNKVLPQVRPRVKPKRSRPRTVSLARAMSRVNRSERRRARTHTLPRIRRRRLRFGDPASASEVPPQWCGTKLRYGPYFPCVKREGRRCLRRSTQRKFGCLRIRRRSKRARRR